jgi:hypothetical protein
MLVFKQLFTFLKCAVHLQFQYFKETRKFVLAMEVNSIAIAINDNLEKIEKILLELIHQSI